MKHVEQAQQNVKQFHSGLLGILCRRLRRAFRRPDVDRFSPRALRAEHAQLVLRQIADALAAARQLELLRKERAHTETIYIQAPDNAAKGSLQHNEEPRMELLDVLLGLLNVLKIGE